MPKRPAVGLNSEFTYGEIVETLARMHEVGKTIAGAFEARIRHFQRLGLVPESPGKGKRIQYNIDTAFDWAFCLELATFGIAPDVIVSIIFRPIKSILLKPGQSLFQRAAADTRGDKIFWYSSTLLFVREGEVDTALGIEPASNIKTHFDSPISRDDKNDQRRARHQLLINLTELRRVVELEFGRKPIRPKMSAMPPLAERP